MSSYQEVEASQPLPRIAVALERIAGLLADGVTEAEHRGVSEQPTRPSRAQIEMHLSQRGYAPDWLERITHGQVLKPNFIDAIDALLDECGFPPRKDEG